MILFALQIGGPIAAGLVVLALLLLLVRWMNGRYLPVQLAGRYLTRLKARRPTIHLITLVIIFVSGASQGLYWWLTRSAHPFSDPKWYTQALHYTALGALVGAVLVGFFLLLFRHLTVFPAISTFGLFLGSAALVAGDKRARVSPFISNEVMVSSQSNLAGVVLKGIDPSTAGEVTDLARNMEQGSLDHLSHPEKLRELGVPEPEGEDPDLKELREKAKGKPGVDFVPVDEHGKKLIPAGQEQPNQRRRVLPGIVVGRELAKNLRLYVGDDVNVISPMGDVGPAGPMPRSRAFRVAGIFYSGMYEYDTKYVYISIPAAQKFLGTDGEITGFEIRIADPDATDEAVGKLKGGLGTGYEVQAWQELNRNLFSALKVEKVAMFIVLCFIIGVAGFSIIANGIMLVREKRRDIAILKSMGAGDRMVLKTFLLMGLYMGVLGVVAGIVTGALTCVLLGKFGISLDTDVYYISKLPVRMNPREVLAVFTAAMSIVIGATVPPALVAAWMRPVDGLRYDQG